MTTQPPKVFISYSHKSPEHDKWVLGLATELRESGVDVVLDQWDLNPDKTNFELFGEAGGISLDGKTLIIANKAYQDDAKDIQTILTEESAVISDRWYNTRKPKFYLAVASEMGDNGHPFLPAYYKSGLWIDLSEPERNAANFENLLRWIFNEPMQPRVLQTKPPLGQRPDFNEPPAQALINTTPINQDYSVRLKQLTLTNFRRFTEFDLNFEQQLTVLVARNGAGKSSILDAVATALGPFLTRLPKVSGINTKETDFRVFADGRKPAYMRISATNEDGISWDRTDKRDQSKPTQAEIPQGRGIKSLNDYADRFVDAYNREIPFELPVFIYYGTGRGVFDIPQRKKGFGSEFSRFEALSGALESRNNFKRFVEYFYYLEERESKLQKEQGSFEVELPELIAIRAVLSRLLPEFSNPRGGYPAG
ncbi:MAG: AAA family ATPase, partial [Psychrosphaera sp.]|nr:AAA family ATPase [Psychrosphaera sp.]